MTDTLSAEEVADSLPDGWDQDGGEIVRTYEFDEYLDGVSFAADVGEVAQEEFHHPSIEIRYKEVEVRLTTHEADGITSQDLDLARLFDDAFASLQ